MVPLILTGAWAERMKFNAFVMFILVWTLLVYYPVAHWIWNDNGFLYEFGTIDFAGGISIHESAGVGALVISIYLEKRRNYTIEPHNLI